MPSAHKCMSKWGNPHPECLSGKSIAMRRAHKCTKSKSEYFPVSGIFPTRTKKDLHRNNLRYTAVVLTVPRKGRPENPNGTKRTAFNVNVSCGRRGRRKEKNR